MIRFCHPLQRHSRSGTPYIYIPRGVQSPKVREKASPPKHIVLRYHYVPFLKGAWNSSVFCFVYQQSLNFRAGKPVDFMFDVGNSFIQVTIPTSRAFHPSWPMDPRIWNHKRCHFKALHCVYICIYTYIIDSIDIWLYGRAGQDKVPHYKTFDDCFEMSCLHGEFPG